MKKYVLGSLLILTGCAVLGDIIFTPQEVFRDYKGTFVCETFNKSYSEYKGKSPIFIYKDFLNNLVQKNTFSSYMDKRISSSKFSNEMKDSVKQLLASNGNEVFNSLKEVRQEFLEIKIEETDPPANCLSSLYYLNNKNCRNYPNLVECQTPQDLEVGYYDTQRQYFEEAIPSIYDHCPSYKTEIQNFAADLLVYYMDLGKQKRLEKHNKLLMKAKKLKKHLGGRNFESNTYDIFKYKLPLKNDSVYFLGSGPLSDFKLTIAQNTQGGWLVDYVVYDTQILPYTLESIKSLSAMGKIFIHNVSNKEAVGDYIPSGFYIYKGIFSYTTVIGGMNSVHSFERLDIPDGYCDSNIFSALKEL